MDAGHSSMLKKLKDIYSNRQNWLNGVFVDEVND